jgi:hypothetical protein
VFSQGCVLNETDLGLFDALCRTSPRGAERGRQVTVSLVGPAVERAKRSGRLREGVKVEDVAAFMRMADSVDTPEQRRVAVEVLLSGRDIGTRPGESSRAFQ